MTLREIQTLVDQAANELTSPNAPGVHPGYQSKQAARTLGRLQAKLEIAIEAETRKSLTASSDSLCDVRLVR